MSPEVIPAINCIDLECVKERLATAKTFLGTSGWVHLDVADGRFTFNRTWGKADEWRAFKAPFHLEVHLMVEEPESVVEEWLKAGAKRIIVHLETVHPRSVNAIFELSKHYRAEAMLALNPETPVIKLLDYEKKFSCFQILAVNPGLAGQKFQPVVLEKVKFLRARMPKAKIEVDGGMNLETARLVKGAGVNIIASANYIFGSNDPAGAYHALKSI